MKSKHKKSIPKTRGHKVEKRSHVPIRKYPVSYVQGGRQETDTQEYSENSQREGGQDGCPDDGRQSQEEHTQIEPLRDTENSEKSVHPGPLQTVFDMHNQGADDQTYANAEIEAEELLEP